MDKYVHVASSRDKETGGPVAADEVRITNLGERKNYIHYAISKFSVSSCTSISIGTYPQIKT
jgi:hypothetical protein